MLTDVYFPCYAFRTDKTVLSHANAKKKTERLKDHNFALLMVIFNDIMAVKRLNEGGVFEGRDSSSRLTD